MDKKSLKINSKSIREVHHEQHNWRNARSQFNKEMVPQLGKMGNKKTITLLKEALRNYLIIRMITIFESFFRTLIKERIDEYNIPLATFYKGEQTAPIALFDKLLNSKPRQITKGIIVAK